MNGEFKVKIEGFEGPLDLLLSLIEKRKLPINDVSLATVTDEYIRHIEEQNELPLQQTSHFVLVASTLLLIKSKSLLPTLNLTQEEEEDIEALEERLKLYKRMKELSVHVSERFGKHILFEARECKSTEPVFAPPKDAQVPLLSEAIARVLASLPKVEVVPQAVVKKVISLEEMIDDLTDRITKNFRMSFFEFSRAGKVIEKEQKVDMIVGFLALLELVKQGIINATQEGKFSDITMETDSVGTPKYE